MIKIKFIKHYRDIKRGTTHEMSDRAAEMLVHDGVAQYVNKEEKAVIETKEEKVIVETKDGKTKKVIKAPK